MEFLTPGRPKPPPPCRGLILTPAVGKNVGPSSELVPLLEDEASLTHSSK